MAENKPLFLQINGTSAKNSNKFQEKYRVSIEYLMYRTFSFNTVYTAPIFYILIVGQ